MFFKNFPTAHFFNTILLPAHIGTLSYAPTHEANPSAKAKEPILPTHRIMLKTFIKYF